mgnify:CR=1 FL=1
MGYTHYWNQSRAFTDEEWTKVVDIFETCLNAAQDKNIVITLSDETKKPSAHEILQELRELRSGEKTRIYFNGLEGSDDLAHETMVLTKDAGGFGFCKTAYKPYDVIVTAFLCAVESLVGCPINTSSDGDAEDWQPGLQLAKFLFGPKVTLPPRFYETDPDEDY